MTQPAQVESALTTTDARFVGKARLEALSDGIFAIVMTLLVLELLSPGWSTLRTAAEVDAALRHLWPKAVSFVISFAIAGIFWVAQHSQFHFIRRTDRRRLWVTLLFLLGVACLPFSAALLGEHPDVRAAVLIYGLNVMLVALALAAQWRYATSSGLTSPELPAGFSRGVYRRIGFGQLAYGSALIVAFVRPEAAFALYVLFALLYVVVQLRP
jgi:uncharacterized membrane protein